jgi:hypothetical protein
MAEVLADEAFEGRFERTLFDPPEGVRRILRRRSGMQSPREQLRNAVHGLREHRDFPTRWRRDHFDRSGAIDMLMDELVQLGNPWFRVTPSFFRLFPPLAPQKQIQRKQDL